MSLDRYWGGADGGAEKARAAMHKHYGEQEGERVFRQTTSLRRMTGKGDGIMGAILDSHTKKAQTRRKT